MICACSPNARPARQFTSQFTLKLLPDASFIFVFCVFFYASAYYRLGANEKSCSWIGGQKIMQFSNNKVTCNKKIFLKMPRNWTFESQLCCKNVQFKMKNMKQYTQYFLNGTVLQDWLVCPIVLLLILIVFGPSNFTFFSENWLISLVFVHN